MTLYFAPGSVGTPALMTSGLGGFGALGSPGVLAVFGAGVFAPAAAPFVGAGASAAALVGAGGALVPVVFAGFTSTATGADFAGVDFAGAGCLAGAVLVLEDLSPEALGTGFVSFAGAFAGAATLAGIDLTGADLAGFAGAALDGLADLACFAGSLAGADFFLAASAADALLDLDGGVDFFDTLVLRGARRARRHDEGMVYGGVALCRPESNRQK